MNFRNKAIGMALFRGFNYSPRRKNDNKIKRYRCTDIDALIVVDMQNDFLPGGALPIKDGDKIIPPINQYIHYFSQQNIPIFFTRDWHPKEHISFQKNGGMWPEHCVQHAKGAAFHPDLFLPKDNRYIISKGDKEEFDAYSGFEGTLLNSLLQVKGIKRLFLCGVATDFCVKNSALSALNLGYQTFLLSDAIKGVFEESSKEAIETLLQKGASLITKDDLYE